MNTLLLNLIAKRISRSFAKNNERGVAMMSALMLIMIVTVLAVLVLGITISQSRPTLFMNKNTRTMSAAQAGIDTAISQIRNATSPDPSGTIMGDIHKLPCRVSGPVEGAGDDTGFVATIAYFKLDPEGKDELWREANALTCYPGPMNPGLRAVPFFAVVTSAGTDSTAVVMADNANRAIKATYTFPLITRNVSGGLITDPSKQFCVVASSASVGSLITFQRQDSGLCTTGHDLSSWSWRNDYMIHLSSTDLDGRVPLCMSGRPTRNSDTVSMALKQCHSGEGDPDGQRYSWTGNHAWRGQNAQNTSLADSYIVNQDVRVDSGDKLSVSKALNSSRFLLPEPLPDVGKGNASKDTDQVVNQSLFGRCLDVTDMEIDKRWMITYPCKQDPSGQGQFDWNHKWLYKDPDTDNGVNSTSTTISVKQHNVTLYCLVTPTNTTSIDGSDPSGRYLYPTFSRDCSQRSAQWTRTNVSTDPSKTSWAFIDRNNRCLSSDGPTINRWKSIIVETCVEGDRHQQWNVPEDPNESSIGNFEEITGRTE